MHPDINAAAWDARDRLLQELKTENCVPIRMLYIRRDDGSALAIGLLPGQGGVVAIDWRGAEYTKVILRQPTLILEPFDQKSEGFGGVFGFGEKGASGWQIKLIHNGEIHAEVTLLPAITAFADVLAKNDRFLYGKRKPQAIPLWQLRPELRRDCEAILTLWKRMVLEGD